MDYTTEELIKIYEEFRLSHTATASDAQLKHWGNSDQEILQIKIDGARAILRNNEGGMLIQRFIDKMRGGNKQQETTSNCTMHGVSHRIFKPNDPEVEEIAEQMDKFVEMYFETKKAGTYSSQLREYMAEILNNYGG